MKVKSDGMDMQKYVKIRLLKHIATAMIEKNECTHDDLMEMTGLEFDELDYFLQILESFYTEIEKEEGIYFKVNESIFSIFAMPDEFFEVLNGFNARKVFEKEIEMLEHGNPLAFLTKTINTVHKGDRELVALNILIGLTPWMKSDQLHYYPVGKSGKGKTSCCSSVLLAFPSSCFEPVTSSSPMSIFYAYTAGKLLHDKIIFFDDIKMNQEFIDVIKAFSGAGKVKPRHWTVDINRRFVDMRPTASYSVWLTSVTPLKDEQLRNRFIIANVDESIKQDKRVLAHIDKTYRHGREREILNLEDFKICRNIVNILSQEKNEVIIPFGIEFPLLGDRRAYIFFLVMIKAIAFASKFQRHRINNYILATYEDFEVARAIYDKIKYTQTHKVDEDALKILNMLPERSDDALSAAQIRELGSISSRNVTKTTNNLLDMGLVSSEKGDSGRWVYWKTIAARDILIDIKRKDDVEENLVALGFDSSLIENIKKLDGENELLKHFEEGKKEDEEKKDQKTLEEFEKKEETDELAEPQGTVTYDDVMGD